MSLVELLFPPAELAAMKHAVLAASEEPAAKRRKVERQNSIRSFRSADSGYNSDDSSHHKNDKSNSTAVPAPATRKPSVTLSASPSTHTPSEEDEFTDVIARARARLYSNASMSLPSPPACYSLTDPNSPTNSNAPPTPPCYETYHSPVSVEPIASAEDHGASVTSGCNLGTFISLGLAVTSYERNLLTTLVPEPKALPSWQMEASAAKRMMGMSMMEARRRMRETEARRQQQRVVAERRAEQASREQPRERKSSYAGFAISCHDEDDEDETSLQAQAQAIQSVVMPLDGAGEEIDDFFNMDDACEEDDRSDCEVKPDA